jgi:hypothetical protein
MKSKEYKQTESLKSVNERYGLSLTISGFYSRCCAIALLVLRGSGGILALSPECSCHLRWRFQMITEP